MVKQEYSTAEVVRLAGLSRHMVNYLCRYELLLPDQPNTGYGIRRRFPFSELLMARVLAKLLNSDVSVLRLRGALETLRKKLRAQSPRNDFCRHVVISGRTVYLRAPGDPVVNLNASGQLAFHFVLDHKEPRRTQATAESYSRKRKT